MEFAKYQLVLGSQSPRRKELLSWLNIPFIIKTADLDDVHGKMKRTEDGKVRNFLTV